MVEHILVNENGNGTKPSAEYSRVFDCFFREGNEYIYDFFDISFLKYSADFVFKMIVDGLKKNKATGHENLQYRGVDLLSCFKLDLFDFALRSIVCAQTLKNMQGNNPAALFFLENDKDDWEYPYLHQIISACPSHITERVRILDTPAKKTEPKTIWYHLKRISVKCCWPEQLSLVRKSPTIAVFSDYQRAKSLMRLLNKDGCLYFANNKAPRIFSNALREGFSYYQIASDQKIQPLLSKAAEAFFETFKRTNSFSSSIRDVLNLPAILTVKIEQLTRHRVPGLLSQIDKIHQFFQAYKTIRRALLDEDITAEKNAFCQIAAQYAVKTYVECHGVLGGNYGFSPLTADGIFAWGKEQKKKLVSWGCPQNAVLVSGCSRYHQYQIMDSQKVRKEICKQFDLDLRKRLILFAPHQVGNERHFTTKIIREKITTILASIFDFPDIQLIIKLHPGDNSQMFYEDIVRRAENMRVKVIKRFDPFLLIKACDFLIVHDSTMAADGFAMDRNVIFFSIFPAEDKVNHSASDYEKYNVFYHPCDMRDFRNILHELIQTPQTRPPSARWEEARRECLNEGGPLAEEIIASYLRDASDTKHAGHSHVQA